MFARPMLFAAVLFGSASAQTPAIQGDWTGVLKVGTAELHLVLHISATPGPVLHATLDSPDQGVTGIAVDAVTLTGRTLTLTVGAAHASYTATLNAEATELHGTWTQGQALLLDLHRSATAIAAELRRPQMPVKPYPYESIEVMYTNPAQHDVLAGTLTVPPGKGPFPAVLLITGSGAQDRDETLFGHKPFLVLADFLTRHGIAVLRADDRGTAKSTGNFSQATTADFATDVEAGLALLRTRPEVDAQRIGLIGHSEGGVIAPMVAARDKGVAFIVLMAGTGVPGLRVINEQAILIAEANGTPKQDAEASAATQESEILSLVVSERDPAVLEKKLRGALANELPANQMTMSQKEAQIQQLMSPWLRYFLTYDPAPALSKVSCPVLALDGSKDLQVPAEENLAAIRAALVAGGNTHFEIIEFAGLNHLFQSTKTGSPNEYAAIEETIAPVVLDKIADWINTQVGKP